MSIRLGLGLLAVGGMIALLPFSNGCASAPDGQVVDNGPSGPGGSPDDDVVRDGNNSAFVSINGGFFDNPGADAGVTTADLDEKSPDASYDPASGISKNAVAGASVPLPSGGVFSNFGNTEVFGGAGATKRIEVTKIDNIDDKGGDAFLMFSQQPVGTQLEVGAAVGGVAPATVGVMKQQTGTATYTGIGQYMVGMGNTSLTSHSGELTMKAEFSGANAGDVSGSIVDHPAGTTVIAGAAQPQATDRVEFAGTVDPDNSSTYTFNKLQLKDGATLQTDFGTSGGKFGGTGAFYGDSAQSTLFVFAGKGTSQSGGYHVNVVGAGRGSR